MILVDSSVWIDHIDHSEPILCDLLIDQRVLIHPYVIGEISLGSLRDRTVVLDALGRLPHAPVATPDEVFYLVERHKVYGRGIGYIDASLLASTKMRGGTALWTRDKRLKKIADELALSATFDH